MALAPPPLPLNPPWDAVFGSCLCNIDCPTASDGVCDDGLADSITSFCAPGSDCADCGVRCPTPWPPPPSSPPDDPHPHFFDVPHSPPSPPPLPPVQLGPAALSDGEEERTIGLLAGVAAVSGSLVLFVAFILAWWLRRRCCGGASNKPSSTRTSGGVDEASCTTSIELVKPPSRRTVEARVLSITSLRSGAQGEEELGRLLTTVPQYRDRFVQIPGSRTAYPKEYIDIQRLESFGRSPKRVVKEDLATQPEEEDEAAPLPAPPAQWPGRQPPRELASETPPRPSSRPRATAINV